MHAATEAILIYNHGRDPDRLIRKYRAIAHDPFTFFRGTNHLYAASLRDEAALHEAPATYVCGDLHLENFGSFKGDNGLVYFDLNDFDEGLVAPLTVDVVRMLSSVMVAGKALRLSEGDAARACEHMLDTYAQALTAGKPRWLERATATGMVAALLRAVKRRSRAQLIAQRTRRKNGARRLIDNDDRALSASKRERERAAAILDAYSRHEDGHRFVADDAVRRIAGVGSLGLERYAVLAREVADDGAPADAARLIDVKRAAPSVWLDMPGALTQPRWESDARRVTHVQQVMQAASPAFLAPVSFGDASYVVKGLQPSADRVALAHCKDGAGLREVLTTMARAAAWAHLRGCGHQAADRIEQLQDFAAHGRWRAPVLRLARHGCETAVAQWKEFREDFEAAWKGRQR